MSSQTQGRLHGKVAVVTGAARGIGRASCIAMARAGIEAVVGIDICANVSERLNLEPANDADLEETGREVVREGSRWLAIKADQRDIGALRRAADDIVATFGGLDILFANAGVQGFKPILEMEDEDWYPTIDVNLTGTMNAIRAFAPHLVSRGGGRIIITSSTQGQHGTKWGSAYSASKWGLIGLMKSAALEFGRYHITVNAVVPGLIDTPLTRRHDRYTQFMGDIDSKKPTDVLEAETRAASASKSPLGVPWIDPSDIAPAVVFLASPEARMVSRAALALTAGARAHLTA